MKDKLFIRYLIACKKHDLNEKAEELQKIALELNELYKELDKED